MLLTLIAGANLFVVPIHAWMHTMRGQRAELTGQVVCGPDLINGEVTAPALSPCMARSLWSGGDSCDVVVCAADDVESLGDGVGVVGDEVPRLQCGRVASEMRAVSGAAGAFAGVMAGAGGSGSGAEGGRNGDMAAGSRAGAGGEQLVRLMLEVKVRPWWRWWRVWRRRRLWSWRWRRERGWFV